MHSLRTKITMLTVWMTVIAMAVVTLVSVLFIRNTEHQQSEQLLFLLCETGERTLDYYFSSVEKSVQKVSTFTERDLDGLEDVNLRAHIERVREYFEETAHKTNGVLTYYYRIDPAVSRTVKGFWYTNLDGDEFIEREVTDISQYDLEDTTKLVWFTVPRKTGKPIWQPPYETENLNMRVISYNYPIFYRGQFIGVIGIEIDYSVMVKQVDGIHLYNNGYAFLTDADGTLIYHPRMEFSTAAERPAMPEGLLSESTFTNYTYENTLKKAAWLRLNNGMRLYVSVPEKETDGDWEQLVRNILIASGVVVALIIAFSHLFCGHITKPLKQLTEAAMQTDQGNYDFTLDYNGKDEVGTLTNTFRRMAEHTKAHISDLNKRVYVDALTSVRNKGAFTTYIEEMQKKMEDSPEPAEYAICVFDCDDLKAINDAHGHDKGDIYLKTAARVICKVFQHSPVFRTGGDEFAAILRNEDYRNRDRLLNEFSKRAEEINTSTDKDWEHVHISVGIAVYDPDEDRSVFDTVRRADKNMYSQKRMNKDAADM